MGHTGTHHSFYDEMFSMLHLVLFIFVYFLWGEGLQGQSMDTRRWGDEWDWGE